MTREDLIRIKRLTINIIKLILLVECIIILLFTGLLKLMLLAISNTISVRSQHEFDIDPIINIGNIGDISSFPFFPFFLFLPYAFILVFSFIYTSKRIRLNNLNFGEYSVNKSNIEEYIIFSKEIYLRCGLVIVLCYPMFIKIETTFSNYLSTVLY